MKTVIRSFFSLGSMWTGMQLARAGTIALLAAGFGGTATTGMAAVSTSYDYLDIYTDSLQDNWRLANWNDPVCDPAAAAPGRSGFAIETTMTNNWQAFGLGDIGDSWTITYHPLNETKVLEFDIYFAGSSGADALIFILNDAGCAETPALVSFIPGWDTMSAAQRYGQWHSVSIVFDDLNPTITSFFRFLFFNNVSGARPHFYVDNVRLGSSPDLLPPSITLGSPFVVSGQLTLPFTTDESATYRIEYGYGDYSQTFTGPAQAATSHSPVLAGLTPGATLQYRIVATDLADNEGVLDGTIEIVDSPVTATVTISVDASNTRAISPWIYGMNFYQQSSSIVSNLTLNRQGGNRWTAYNWENNASNAGADWYYHNDGYLGGGNVPGEALRPLVEADRTRGNASLLTVQMQGYVAADKNGDNVTLVTPMSTRLATRFKEVVYKKPVATAGAFTTAPDATDDYVYMDEFVWAMDQLVPGGIYTDPVNPTFLMLDNEPELWGDTHAEIQDGLVSPDDYIAKTIALGTAVKDVAPDVTLFGPVHFGFSGIYSWQGSSGFNAGHWFTDRYLSEMKAASDSYGRRLIDVYTFHWYSEATDGSSRVTSFSGSTLSDAQIQAIVQSPRSLWDPTFTEDSWITEYVTGGPIRLLPTLQDKIDATWPGTRLAITEWNNGGNNHIAGAIAIADNLGIFGQYGLFAASYWPLSGITTNTFDAAGFKMFRDFDGALGSFGDICLPATSDNTALVSAYVSRDSANPNRHVIVAINRSNAAQTIGFDGLSLAGTARLFRLTGSSNTPSAAGTATIDLSTWLLAAPAYSITTVEITSEEPATYADWRAANFSGTDLADDAVSGPTADPDNAGLSNYARYAFNRAARGPVDSPLTVGGTATSDGSTYFTITFNRRSDATDLSYIVEGSDDLETWTPVQTNAPGTPTTLTVPDSVPMESAPCRFLRVHVTTP